MLPGAAGAPHSLSEQLCFSWCVSPRGESIGAGRVCPWRSWGKGQEAASALAVLSQSCQGHQGCCHPAVPKTRSVQVQCLHKALSWIQHYIRSGILLWQAGNTFHIPLVSGFWFLETSHFRCCELSCAGSDWPTSSPWSLFEIEPAEDSETPLLRPDTQITLVPPWGGTALGCQLLSGCAAPPRRRSKDRALMVTVSNCRCVGSPWGRWFCVQCLICVAWSPHRPFGYLQSSVVFELRKELR